MSGQSTTPKFYNQGDIALIDFPFADGSRGKVRPVLVVSRDRVNRGDNVVVVKITSAQEDRFSRIRINPTDITRTLPRPSQVVFTDIHTVSKKLILKKISTMKKAPMKIILEAIQGNFEQD